MPEGTILGFNTLCFAHPNASALQKEFVSNYIDNNKAAPVAEAERAFFNLTSAAGPAHAGARRKVAGLVSPAGNPAPFAASSHGISR